MYKYLYESSGRQLLGDALGQYLSPSLVRQVLENYEAVHLGGEKKTIAVFFSDIQGFTTLSESLPPETLISLLSTYLDTMSRLIMEEDGFVNKYEGDAIMAIW